MRKTLVITNKIGPTVGLVIKCLEEVGEEALVYFTRDSRFLSANGPELPVWAREPRSYEFQKWLLSFIREENIEKVIAIGFDSSLLCEPFAEHIPVITLLLPGEIDISFRRKRRLSQFKRLSALSKALVFFNSWEMYKATSIGSVAPHFVWDLKSDGASIAWKTSDNVERRIAVFYDHDRRGRLEDVEELGIPGMASGFNPSELELVPSNSLFWHRDLEIGRSLVNTAALRTSSFTHAIFVDNDSESLVAAACADTSDSDALFATHSVEHELLSYGSDGIIVGSIPRIQTSIAGKTELEVAPRDSSGFFSGRPLAQILEIVLAGEMPRYFEDFGDSSNLNIFFSVAALENRSNGARPQRIRNMYLAMARESQPIHLSFNSNVLDRRTRLIRYLVNEGVKFDYFYGENSTNPIFSFDGPLAISRLVDLLAHESSLKSLYFVRDVHWLDSSLQDQGEIDSQTLEYGKFELKRLAASLGGLIAPSRESAELYSELASPYFDLEFVESELPPALSPRNIAPASLEDDPDEARLTFVYTGGVSRLYAMDGYLAALRQVILTSEGRVYADFVVREEEREMLEDWLSEYGIKDCDSIRIITESFESYSSRTAKNIGILLLDSRYGKSAFAFKAVSYLERMIPFIVYSDSPNSRYFEEYGVALSVHDREGVEGVMRAALDNYPVGIRWNELVAAETWDNRWETVKEVASCKRRERR